MIPAFPNGLSFPSLLKLSETSLIVPLISNSERVLFFGLKGAYHLNSVIKQVGFNLNPRRWDLYVSGMIGFNKIGINSPNELASVDDIINAEIDRDSKIRGGLSLGLRYFYSNSFSIFMEGTLNHYGYTRFGICYSPL